MGDNELTHYGVLGMRWRHHQRETAAGRANRAHQEHENFKNLRKGVTDPYERKALDRENAAKRTGKKSDALRAKRARMESDFMKERYNGDRVARAFAKRDAKKDEAVRRIDKIISEKGELKLKSVEFDRWRERHPQG